MKPEDCFLGLDLSTQSLTAVVTSLTGSVAHQVSISFDDAYPSYHTKGGVRLGENVSEVFADPRMWAQAMDDILILLKDDTWTGSIRAIGVSAQQHGTVYLKSTFVASLQGLDPALQYHRQIQHVFSRDLSPVWMDSSTHEECREITEALGGPVQVAALTGSVATERFAGPQIRRFWKRNPEEYERTSHIALVSSFLTSLLAGRLAPVDSGDSRILLETEHGNQGKIMLPYFLPEITRLVLKPGVRRFGGLTAEDIPGNVRAVAEAQAMAMVLHSGWIGPRPKRILVTAGGSGNRGLLSVLSQVLGAGVCSFEVKESAALGAAIRAAHAFLRSPGKPVKWSDLFESVVRPNAKELVRPSADAVQIYQGPNGLLTRSEACEQSVLR